MTQRLFTCAAVALMAITPWSTATATKDQQLSKQITLESNVVYGMSASDPVNRESARVQAVVASAAPTDLTLLDTPVLAPIVAVFLGQTESARDLYKEASPVTHVTVNSAPFLLVHGDTDDVIPFRNSQQMIRALKEAGVDTESRDRHQHAMAHGPRISRLTISALMTIDLTAQD